MSGATEIAVVFDGWRKVRGAKAMVMRAIAACRTRLDRAAETAETSVILCDDEEIRRLNRSWRGKDKATNVLSFPAARAPGGGGAHLGDIAIAYETVAREAADERKTMTAHLSHMAVHGYLHLAGYDHETEADAEQMEALEREILALLGIDDPYADAAPAPSPRQDRRRAR